MNLTDYSYNIVKDTKSSSTLLDYINILVGANANLKTNILEPEDNIESSINELYTTLREAPNFYLRSSRYDFNSIINNVASIHIQSNTKELIKQTINVPEFLYLQHIQEPTTDTNTINILNSFVAMCIGVYNRYSDINKSYTFRTEKIHSILSSRADDNYSYIKLIDYILEKLSSITTPVKYIIARYLTIFDFMIYILNKDSSKNIPTTLNAVSLVTLPANYYYKLEDNILISNFFIKLNTLSYLISRLNTYSVLDVNSFMSSRIYFGLSSDDIVYRIVRPSSSYITIPTPETTSLDNFGMVSLNSFIYIYGIYPKYVMRNKYYINPDRAISYVAFSERGDPPLFYYAMCPTSLTTDIIRLIIATSEINDLKNKHSEQVKSKEPFILSKNNDEYFLLDAKIPDIKIFSRDQYSGDSNKRDNKVYGAIRRNIGVPNLFPEYTHISIVHKPEMEIFPNNIICIETFNKPNIARLPIWLGVHNTILGLVIPLHQKTINFILHRYGIPKNDYSHNFSIIGEMLAKPQSIYLSIILNNFMMAIGNGTETIVENLALFSFNTDRVKDIDLRYFFNKKELITTNSNSTDMGVFIPLNKQISQNIAYYIYDKIKDDNFEITDFSSINNITTDTSATNKKFTFIGNTIKLDSFFVPKEKLNGAS